VQPLKVQATGVLLFLFIPVVLFLYVRHPEPIGASLIAGVVLMMGHRLLARPYMERVLPVKCAWCNRVPPAEGGETLELRSGERLIEARCCPGHRQPAAKFFAFLDSWRWILRAGIFLPLLLLLVTLAAAAFGAEPPVEEVTAFFKLAVGITVNLAALGYLVVQGRSPAAVPFPVHNFFLLGVRNLLWVFRLVGIWWIWQGLRWFLG
jgi:hypothetical protein